MADMIIKNGMVFHEDGTFYQDTLFIENGQIAKLLSAKDAQCIQERALQNGTLQVLDASDLYVIPGLVDIHSHGAAGFDFSDADREGLKEILRFECSRGITSYCPTSMTLEKETLKKVFAAARDASDENDLAQIVGINMEGPFLSAKKKGAHVEAYIQVPDIAFFRECQKACDGLIRLVTVAPEVDGAEAFIRELHREAVISLGHTDADYAVSKKALQAGARHVTHLFNAMRPFAHREPGLVGAASECSQCMAELICDGIHVHESMVRAAFRLFPDRIVLISDSMRAAGLDDGNYELGGQQVQVEGRLAKLSDGTIAGSVTNLYDCMCQAVAFGIPLEQAVAAATMHPAQSIGRYDAIGSLSPGKRADVLLMDAQMRLVQVIRAGYAI